MRIRHKLKEYAPLFEPDVYSVGERRRLEPFFTNLNKSVSVPLGMAPEVIGALCSRASRAAHDLRRIFLDEYLKPFLDPQHEEGESEEEWRRKVAYCSELTALIDFLRDHPVEKIFSNPRARSFYIKWLAQYGDDSIAQMAGTHVLFSGISLIAIKHFEDQRIGLAPIEKSTRYVDYSTKVGGQYMYYIDPTLKDYGLEEEYIEGINGLFDAYTKMLPKLQGWLMRKFPSEKPAVVEKKAFDTLRGLLPTSTLSQVAFFGNGQAFEYMIARSAKHRLGEIRWAAQAALEEINKVVPSFLRRLKAPEALEVTEKYQEYLGSRQERMASLAYDYASRSEGGIGKNPYKVRLVEYDPEGESKVLAGMLYSASSCHSSWQECLRAVRGMSKDRRRDIIGKYLAGRDQRWQKVGRAFENSYLRFEVEMDIGAWRDLHRHRMLTQQRQFFTCQHGYVVPEEVAEASLGEEYEEAINRVEEVYGKIAQHSLDLAQYAVTLAHRIRFMQWENVRECFWEMELRTIPEGHPGYRKVEQEKYKLFAEVFPLIAQYMRVNMGDYEFARRGQEEKIQEKLKQLEKIKV